MEWFIGYLVISLIITLLLLKYSCKNIDEE